MAISRPRPEVEREIRETLGLVPGFFDGFPDEMLDIEWSTFRYFELEETRIPSKYKQLIAVGIHAETKCQYCTLFHSELARFFGASDEELQEAVHLANYTVGLSVYLNGTRYPFDRFERELEKILEFVGQPNRPEPEPVR